MFGFVRKTMKENQTQLKLSKNLYIFKLCNLYIKKLK